MNPYTVLPQLGSRNTFRAELTVDQMIASAAYRLVSSVERVVRVFAR